MNRVSYLLDNLEFKKERDDLSSHIIPLTRIGSEVCVFYSVVTRDEVYYNELFYTTNLVGEYLALIEAFITLAQGKPVEGVDRISIKELDYFLRAENSIPSFDHYTPEMFEILSIGEELRKIIIPRNVDESFILDVSQDGSFEKLSYSEQLDFIEEFFSKFVYADKSYEGFSFDFEVETDILISVNSVDTLSENQCEFIIEGIIRELQLSEIKVRFN
jgi:hypothetical protein